MAEVISADGRYPVQAYAFLNEALAKAVKETYGEGEEPSASEAGPPRETGRQHHVTGKQLCLALRDLAVERWGLLARTVLARWNIHNTIDFGNMVYLLVENNFMRKTEQDDVEDFRDVFDFDQAFNADALGFELKE